MADAYESSLGEKLSKLVRSTERNSNFGCDILPNVICIDCTVFRAIHRIPYPLTVYMTQWVER